MISVTGNNAAPYAARVKQHGFTLLEVLVALAVVAVVSAALIPSLVRQSPERQLETETDRLRRVMDLMCERAELDGRVLGLAISNSSYAVQIPGKILPEPGKEAPWEELKGAVWATHTLPKTMTLSLQTGSRGEVAELSDELPSKPQLPCAGQLELPEFALRIRLPLDEGPLERLITAMPASADQLQSGAVQVQKLR